MKISVSADELVGVAEAVVAELERRGHETVRHGALGEEDLAVVRPAVELLRAEGIDARGPLPADTLFHQAARATYDVALAMYHDQALIPIKTLAFDHAVNVTLGLPFVRTSPDHGTAFAIAGKQLADAGATIAAIRMAGEIAVRRAAA